MPAGPPALLLSHLRRLVEAHGLGELSDRELLERFAADHDEAAFAALLRRHGPMVFRTCHRVLHNAHDAEDVFQATFLVFARKATALRWHTSVAGWLHEVAHRLAMKVQTGTARRLARERQSVERQSGDPLADLTGRELVAVIDEELSRLPEKYRTPLVLCLLEGRTRDEAAKLLGYSARTVKRRLERGRGLLSARLTRRGLALSAALSGALLTPAVAPAALMQTTIEAATGFAPGHAAAGGIISAPVAALTQGVLKAMFWTKCKLVATVILTTTALGLGSGALAWQRGGTGAGEEPSTPVAQAPQGEGAKPNDERSGAKEKADGTSDVAPMSTEVWEEWATLKGHLVKDKAKPVLSASFSPDGKTLATANSDGAVWLWDVAIGARVDQKPQRVILAEGIDVRSHAVRAVLFSPDGTRLSAGADKTIKLWDVKSGKDLIGFQEHKDNILGLAFSPDGKTLASTSADGTTRLTETTTGKVVFETAVQSARILTVAFSPDGKSLALANAEPELLLLDLKTGQVIRRLRGHAREIHSLAISPNGKLLATASRDKTIRLWDLASGKELRQISSSDEAVKSVMFSPDGKLLVTGGQDKTVRILDHTTGMLVATLTGHTGPVYCVMFSPDGKTIASASEDGTVKLWSAKRVVVERSGAVTPAAKGDHLDKLLDDLIKAKKTDDQIVEALYLATLARLPLENEKAFVLKHLEKQGERRQAALTDVLFTLTNSKEFSANLDALKQRDSRRGK